MVFFRVRYQMRAHIRWAPIQISSEAKWTIERLLKFFFGFVGSDFCFWGALQQLCLAKFKHATLIRTCLKFPESETSLQTEHIFRKVFPLKRIWQVLRSLVGTAWLADMHRKSRTMIWKRVRDIFITKTFYIKLWLLDSVWSSLKSFHFKYRRLICSRPSRTCQPM